MDPQKETFEKKQVEVVLVIPEEGAAPDSSRNHISVPKVESLDDLPKDPNPNPKPYSPIGHPSPEAEIIKSSSSPKKPPRPPRSEALRHRRSISKPKSRFVEQPLPPGASKSVEDGRPPGHDRSSSSPNPRASGTSKTPLAAADEEEEEEDEEVYKKDQFPESRKRGRRWKVRTLTEWMILILAMGCVAASLIVRRLQGFVIWGLDIWKWCLMVTVICCGRLVTHWFITALVFLIEMNFLLRNKVLYFVYGLKNSVQVCIWLGLVLLSWSLLFNQGVRRSPKTEKVLGYISRALASLLIGSVIWLVKTLSMKILSSSFHMNKFFDRIQESIFHQYVLQTLSGPPVMELAEKAGTAKSTGKLSFRSMGKGKGKKGEEQEVIDVGKLHKMNQEKVSAWTMKGLINVIRTSGLTTITNTIESFDEEGHKDSEITSEWEAKAAAYRIFKNVAKPGCK